MANCSPRSASTRATRVLGIGLSLIERMIGELERSAETPVAGRVAGAGEF